MDPHGPAFFVIVPLGTVKPTLEQLPASKCPALTTIAIGQIPTVLLRHASAQTLDSVRWYFVHPVTVEILKRNVTAAAKIFIVFRISYALIDDL